MRMGFARFHCMKLETRIEKMLNDAVYGDPRILERTPGIGDPEASFTTTEYLDILRTQVYALRKAVLIIASEIDKAREG
jgi:hypothetical protein